MDDEEFLHELLEEMVGEMNDVFVLLKKAIKSGDRKRIKNHAHSIKGTTANLYVERVSNGAMKLELMATSTYFIHYTNLYFLPPCGITYDLTSLQLQLRREQIVQRGTTMGFTK